MKKSWGREIAFGALLAAGWAVVHTYRLPVEEMKAVMPLTQSIVTIVVPTVLAAFISKSWRDGHFASKDRDKETE